MCDLRLDLVFDSLFASVFGVQGTLNSFLNLLFALNLLAADTPDLIDKDTLNLNFLHVIVHNKLLGKSLEKFWLQLTFFLFADSVLGKGVRFKHHIVHGNHPIELLHIFGVDHIV